MKVVWDMQKLKVKFEENETKKICEIVTPEFVDKITDLVREITKCVKELNK